jgi:hypothetical protein
MSENTPMSDDDKRWLDWQRGDVRRKLRERGWDEPEVEALMSAMTDEAFQVIRAQAVEELAEHYILGMRLTVRIREVLAYAAGMRPSRTERSDDAHRRRNAGLLALSRREYPRVPKQQDRND